MKVHVRAYGCQMNVRDTESICALLRSHGFEATGSEADADVVIVNTCSVRGKAEDKAIGKLGLLTASKRNRPGFVVGAMGCMVQRLGRQMFDSVQGLDFAIGTRALSRLPRVLDLVMSGQGPILDVGEHEDDVEALSGHTEMGVSAFVNILFGCDRRCTYCIVPHVRGREWSREGLSIVEEVRRTLAAGRVKEVTLLGQSVMSYGRRNAVWPEDYSSPRSFTEPLSRLLEAVDSLDGLARLRFTSGHPSGVTCELVRAMSDLPSVCEHLHLPVQSGSNRVLKMMKRGYDVDGYRAAVERLRAAMPTISLSTDVIVGFPSETEEDFEQTRAFMDEIGFDQAFIFKYSPRPGTSAADLEDDVPDEEKRRRNQVLLEDQDRRSRAANEALVGQEVEVLVEGESLRNADRWSGRTRTNRIAVFAPVPGLEAGQRRRIAVESAMPQTLYGRVVDGDSS